jgi:outer membrane protein TolC
LELFESDGRGDFLAGAGETGAAQTQSGDQAKRVFTLEQAVDFALKNYPAVRTSLERVRAAEAGVGLARTNYLPRGGRSLAGQSSDRQQHHRIAAAAVHHRSISGPVPISASNQSAWGSAAGLLFSWEPLDFGYREAKVDAARAAQNRATAEASLTRLDVGVATVNAYMTLLAAEQTVRAAQADVHRREEFVKSVHVLVDNQLRPGADASRADADLARARVNLARAQQQDAISRAFLADILGIADSRVEIQESGLLGGMPVRRRRWLPSPQTRRRRCSKHASTSRNLRCMFWIALTIQNFISNLRCMDAEAAWTQREGFLQARRAWLRTGPIGPWG